MLKIGIIGGGNMGEALIKGALGRCSVNACEASLRRRVYLKKVYKLKCTDLKTLVKKSKVIVLAVKPQGIDVVLNDLAKVITADKVILSIAAGVTSRYIEKKIKRKPRVVRSMPNMPALIGEGISAISKGRFAKDADLQLAKKVLGYVGEVVVVKENLIDAITATSGSGPAYVFLFMECMIDAAKKLGLKETVAKDLVKKTFSGSVNLLQKINAEPAVLRAKVTSKGGTTQAATDVFRKKKIDQIINQALKAAQKRAKQLSRG